MQLNAAQPTPSLSVSSSSSPELGLRKNTWIGSRWHQLRKIAAVVDSLHAAGRDGGRGDEGRSAAVVRLSVRVLPSVRPSVDKTKVERLFGRHARTHSLGERERGEGVQVVKKEGSKFIVQENKLRV